MKSRDPLVVYLSGGMEFAKREGADWRLEMERWIADSLGHKSYNPNKESDAFLARVLPGGRFRDLKRENIQQYVTIVRDMIDMDCQEIARRSDYVVCNWDESAQRGAGTKGELTIARFVHKPVFLVTTMELHEIPGWVLGCATNIFASFDELKIFLSKKYTSSVM